jgi:tetratricopeptide (TPR) repeat protein
MTTMIRNLLVLILILYYTPSIGQELKNKEQLYNYASKLQGEKKWNDALTIFKNLLKSDSSNVEYLWRTSYIYSILGFGQSTEEARQQWYRTGAYLGKKAITQHPQHANAHYAYAVAVGRMSEHAGNKTKIQNAKLIKSEAETAIKLDPKLPGPYHILGRWHRVVAGFSGFERAMIKAIFGGLEGGSHEESILNFEKAIQLEPLNAIHYIEAANSYIERNEINDKQQAKNWLQKALNIPIRSPDDEMNKKTCEAMLKKL